MGKGKIFPCLGGSHILLIVEFWLSTLCQSLLLESCGVSLLPWFVYWLEAGKSPENHFDSQFEKSHVKTPFTKRVSQAGFTTLFGCHCSFFNSYTSLLLSWIVMVKIEGQLITGCHNYSVCLPALRFREYLHFCGKISGRRSYKGLPKTYAMSTLDSKSPGVNGSGGVSSS